MIVEWSTNVFGEGGGGVVWGFSHKEGIIPHAPEGPSEAELDAAVLRAQHAAASKLLDGIEEMRESMRVQAEGFPNAHPRSFAITVQMYDESAGHVMWAYTHDEGLPPLSGEATFGRVTARLDEARDSIAEQVAATATINAASSGD